MERLMGLESSSEWIHLSFANFYYSGVESYTLSSKSCMSGMFIFLQMI